MSSLPQANTANSLGPTPSGNDSGLIAKGKEGKTVPFESTWQRDLATAIRHPQQLLAALELSDKDFPGFPPENITAFPLLAPLSFVDRMEVGNPDDPLLQQVLPTAAELQTVDGFVADAVGDRQAKRAPGLLQKYRGRALMIATGSCAVHCRYCFRRSYPYAQEPRRLSDWEPALQELESDQSVVEVILSGGDPLMLTNSRLRQLVDRLDTIDHIDRIRIHTRLPIVLPSRIEDDLLQLLVSTRTQVIVVVHANHANEIRGDCRESVHRLITAGLPVLNQTVLLRGINDTPEALEALSHELINVGVIPYYLHQLDRVAGAAHFEVDTESGQRLITKLRSRLPGYAVPQFVQETPGSSSKTLLESGISSTAFSGVSPDQTSNGESGDYKAKT